MTSVTYTFNLDPVAASARQSANATSAASTSQIGAQYQAVEAGVRSDPALAGIQAPACASGDCFVVHGDGPGVTTLSIGEEDGGTGDFLSLPMVDGVQFAEPPITSFASAGEYDVSTLAIGEEDGGIAVASSEIGAPPAASSVVEYVEQVTLDPMPIAKPEFSFVMESTQTASALPPIETTPILEPRLKPAEFASAGAPMPEWKPSSDFASAGVPMPDLKPEIVPSGFMAKGQSIPVASPASEATISVGDYDSYIASLGGEGGSTPAAAPMNVTVESVQTPTPERVEMTFQPVTSTQPAAVEPQAVSLPAVQPATFTTGPATAAPDVFFAAPSPADQSIMITPEMASSGESAATMSEVDTPVPAEKPDAINSDAPRLSLDDFRITTLALGEEDAGGG